ncbi:Uncharacterised protein (plasmid) [Tsukamurella tyrosinosolvens]|uniref:Uncharacterized protein n=1 Tax=Tsukamurella tyrosinosolvens TaxID=57704 RepID=A0A1H4NPV2_TSUTY|nr:hypothetical protein [Tsukamurella tyrosinosolvens]KXO97185.1 hypothetical protein AXK58_08050 [Tsukamurella tyrosinosolvens]SEB97293.1 hypothetical protein SAMN04489793_1235 [Tsukamurella tyrosinosolvens]VEI00097.1 Uncharacterised protein [Tsukamurella tyrosinosolvens]
MNRKATPFIALVAAATVAVAPAAGAAAATAAPAVHAAGTAAPSPAQVLQTVSGATGAATLPAGLTSAARATEVAPLVVVTDESAKAGAAAAGVSATSEPVALSSVPASVQSALDIAGLPVAAVWRVFQTGNGIYTVFYKLAFNTIPNALLKGQWGSIPTAFETAVKDSLTWITTGAGPKAPDTGTTPKATVPAAPSVTAVPSVVTNALNVAGIPVATAWATFQAANTVYTNFTSLVSTVPNALISGNWGKIPTLVIDAVAKSITTIADFPGAQIKAASEKIEKLIASLTPPAATPATTGADALSVTRTAAATEEDSVTTSVADKTADSQKPASQAVVETSKPAAEQTKPVVAAETAGPAAEPSKPVATEPVAEPVKPVETTVGEVEASPAKAVDAAPAESKPIAEATSAKDSAPATDAAAPESKPAASEPAAAETVETTESAEGAGSK